MTIDDLKRVRARAAMPVARTLDRRGVVAWLRRSREDVAALALEVERLNEIVRAQAAELLERDLKETGIGGLE